jgi:hypothetical protein
MPLAIALLALDGASAMQLKRSHGRTKIENGVLVVPFSYHNFGARCFDTLNCRVTYGKVMVARDNEAQGPFTERQKKRLSASVIGIDNFPGPADVTWTSKDGEVHHTEVDIGEMFRAQRLLYGPDLNVDDVALDIEPFPPSIILVVEDRAIHVFMRSHISLRHPSDPSRPLSDFREDVILFRTQRF